MSRKLDFAYDYYGRFHNVFTDPGLVERGEIKHLPLKQTREQLAESLLICTANEMIDRLKDYEQLGVDELIMNVNIGHSGNEALESLERFGTEVLPHFEVNSLPRVSKPCELYV